MADTQIQVAVPVEINDVLQAVLAVVKAVKSGKSVPIILAEELPTLIKLMGEVDKLDDNFKNEPSQSIDCAMLVGRQILWAVLGK